jgi:ribosomal protein S18 acetylase RimI-like enzyme
VCLSDRKKNQGQGLGRKLMDGVLRDLKLSGFQYATIGVGLREERNQRIYDHMGFSKKIKICYFDPCAMDENMNPQQDEGFLLLSKQL